MPDFNCDDGTAQARKKLLRQRLLAARRALSPTQRDCAADAVAARIVHSQPFLNASHVAGYLAMPSELDVERVLHAARSAGKSVAVPVIAGDQLRFVRWTNGPELRGTLGTREPLPPHDWIDPQELDLVLTPLVGFTAAGGRLGMGGGYYDRTFAFRRHRSRPLLLGIAYAFQQLDTLPDEPWDIPLDGVLTPDDWFTMDQAS